MKQRSSNRREQILDSAARRFVEKSCSATSTRDIAQIVVAMQNTLKHKARLCDVIARNDAEGGMFKTVQGGYAQTMIGISALEFQDQVESGEQIIVGVNAFRVDEDARARPVPERPDQAHLEARGARLKEVKAMRDQSAVEWAIDAPHRAAQSQSENIFAAENAAVPAGVTMGGIVRVLRKGLGFGRPLIMA